MRLLDKLTKCFFKQPKAKSIRIGDWLRWI